MIHSIVTIMKRFNTTSTGARVSRCAIAVAILVGVFVHTVSPPCAAGTALTVGDIAPNWVLQSTQDEAISLYDQADAGKTTVLIFWASWCQHCSVLLPELSQHETEFNSFNTQVYLLHLWEEKPAEDLKMLNSTPYPILLKAGSVARRLGVDTTPGVVIVGANKHILYQRKPSTPLDNIVPTILDIIRKGDETPGDSSEQRTVLQGYASPSKSSNKSSGSTSPPSN